MTELKLKPGDRVILRTRHDVNEGEVVCEIVRPFNATGGEWLLKGDHITLAKDEPE